MNDDLLPEPGLDREAMLAVQARVRERARFVDGSDGLEGVVVGADLAFDDDDAIAAAVAMRSGSVIDRAHVREPVAFPYVPGLLAFREVGPMVRAIEALDVTPALVLCDGNGRIHFREAGLATHLGVILDLPTVGIAKSLLCGVLKDPPDPPFAAGVRVPIRPGDRMAVPVEGPLGYAAQTRQWDRGDRHINPVYVSPGHRVAPVTAVDLVFDWLDGYKLPEPVREADQLAGTVAREG